jgi:DNA-binding transcriptional ArsR family regulator
MKKHTHPALEEVSLEEAMKALSDPCRVSIVRTLLQSKSQGLACNEFGLKVSKATRSHHFEALRAAGLIATHMDGTKCLSSLRQREFNKRFPGLLKLVASAGKNF